MHTLAKEWAKPFYNSKEWKQCRVSYIASVHGLCETCLSKDRITPGKILHHTVWLTPENINDPYVSLNHALLKYECQECHNKEEVEPNEATVDGLMFDESGQLVRRVSDIPPIK